MSSNDDRDQPALRAVTDLPADGTLGGVEKDVTTKDVLRRLVDELPVEELPAARRFLEYLRDRGDPVLRAFMDAPEDDEPPSEEEEAVLEAELAEAEEELHQGAGLPWDQVRRSILQK